MSVEHIVKYTHTELMRYCTCVSTCDRYLGQVRERAGGADSHGRHEARPDDCQSDAGRGHPRASRATLHSRSNGTATLPYTLACIHDCTRTASSDSSQNIRVTDLTSRLTLMKSRGLDYRIVLSLSIGASAGERARAGEQLATKRHL